MTGFSCAPRRDCAVLDPRHCVVSMLGQALLGVIVGKNARTLARWTHATARPPHASEKLLRDTFQVFEILISVHSPNVARAWFMGMNPELGDASPAEALGRTDVPER
jgi:hypothetical protein